MKCPFCATLDSKVVDSRPANDGTSIRRRRECLKCHNRFTTYETIEVLPMIVIKKNGIRQAFDRSKLMTSMLKACEKRSVSLSLLEKAADDIEKELQNELGGEVSSKQIGELVMEKLKDLDEVAYVRFASVYRQFKDINTFMDELNKLLDNKNKAPAPSESAKVDISPHPPAAESASRQGTILWYPILWNSFFIQCVPMTNLIPHCIISLALPAALAFH